MTLSKTGGLGDLGLTITDLALAAKAEIDTQMSPACFRSSALNARFLSACICVHLRLI